MATSIGIGVPVPKLLPVTGSFVVPFAAYYFLLGGRVSLAREEHKKYLGDRAHTDPTKGPASDPLLVANRCHGNFAEHVPFAIFLASVVELNGGNRSILSYSLAALFALRVAHVELGLRGKDALAPGRITGAVGTQFWIVGMASYGAYLVKSYWGF